MPACRSIRVPILASPGVPLAFSTSTVTRGPALPAPGTGSAPPPRSPRQAASAVAPQLLIERSARLEIVRQIEHPADVVPLSVAERVVAHRVEHSPVGLAGLRGAFGRERAVEELVGRG